MPDCLVADHQGSALLTIEGELDDISGSGQTEAAQDLCTGIAADRRNHLEVKGAGHYGIFSGRRWRDIVYPKVRAFILEHELPAEPAASAAAPASPKLASPSPAPAKAAPVAKTTTAKAPKAAAKPAPAHAAANPAGATAVATRWVQPAATPTGAAQEPTADLSTAQTSATAAPSTRSSSKSKARKA